MNEPQPLGLPWRVSGPAPYVPACNILEAGADWYSVSPKRDAARTAQEWSFEAARIDSSPLTQYLRKARAALAQKEQAKRIGTYREEAKKPQEPARRQKEQRPRREDGATCVVGGMQPKAAAHTRAPRVAYDPRHVQGYKPPIGTSRIAAAVHADRAAYEAAIAPQRERARARADAAARTQRLVQQQQVLELCAAGNVGGISNGAHMKGAKAGDGGSGGDGGGVNKGLFGGVPVGRNGVAFSVDAAFCPPWRTPSPPRQHPPPPPAVHQNGMAFSVDAAFCPSWRDPSPSHHPTSPTAAATPLDPTSARTATPAAAPSNSAHTIESGSSTPSVAQSILHTAARMRSPSGMHAATAAAVPTDPTNMSSSSSSRHAAAAAAAPLTAASTAAFSPDATPTHAQPTHSRAGTHAPSLPPSPLPRKLSDHEGSQTRSPAPFIPTPSPPPTLAGSTSFPPNPFHSFHPFIPTPPPSGSPPWPPAPYIPPVSAASAAPTPSSKDCHQLPPPHSSTQQHPPLSPAPSTPWLPATPGVHAPHPHPTNAHTGHAPTSPEDAATSTNPTASNSTTTNQSQLNQSHSTTSSTTPPGPLPPWAFTFLMQATGQALPPPDLYAHLYPLLLESARAHARSSAKHMQHTQREQHTQHAQHAQRAQSAQAAHSSQALDPQHEAEAATRASAGPQLHAFAPPGLLGGHSSQAQEVAEKQSILERKRLLKGWVGDYGHLKGDVTMAEDRQPPGTTPGLEPRGHSFTLQAATPHRPQGLEQLWNTPLSELQRTLSPAKASPSSTHGSSTGVSAQLQELQRTLSPAKATPSSTHGSSGSTGVSAQLQQQQQQQQAPVPNAFRAAAAGVGVGWGPPQAPWRGTQDSSSASSSSVSTSRLDALLAPWRQHLTTHHHHQQQQQQQQTQQQSQPQRLVPTHLHHLNQGEPSSFNHTLMCDLPTSITPTASSFSHAPGIKPSSFSTQTAATATTPSSFSHTPGIKPSSSLAHTPGVSLQVLLGMLTGPSTSASSRTGTRTATDTDAAAVPAGRGGSRASSSSRLDAASLSTTGSAAAGHGVMGSPGVDLLPGSHVLLHTQHPRHTQRTQHTQHPHTHGDPWHGVMRVFGMGEGVSQVHSSSSSSGGGGSSSEDGRSIQGMGGCGGSIMERRGRHSSRSSDSSSGNSRSRAFENRMSC